MGCAACKEGALNAVFKINKMPRFFVPDENFSDGFVKITGEDAHHIARALRMAVGDEVTVCDMQGRAHSCVLTKIRDEESELKIVSTLQKNTESPISISLYMGYPKGDKLEFIVQKAVELGAHRIIPFESSRCVKKPKLEKIEKQTERLIKIANEASKQCGRSVLTTVCAPLSFEAALSEAKMSGETILFCYEGEQTVSIKAALQKVKKGDKVAIFVGTEGGFSYGEVEKALSFGAISVGLGPRILRCETAPIYALSAISYQFEI